jgi:cholesterol transport system auxiliary component
MMRRHLPVVALFLALSACAGKAPPPDAFHRVLPGPAATRFAAPALAGVVEVERLATDGVLAERAITFMPKDGGSLLHYSYDYWSEPPGVLIQDQLAGYLISAGLADRVVTPELRVLPDWTVRGKIMRFEHLPAGGKVAVEMRLVVVSARDGRLVLLESYGIEVPTEGEGIEAAVAAVQRGVTELFSRFLADLGRIGTEGRR